MENNFFCKFFSHKFITIYNTKSEPLSGNELNSILSAIKNSTTTLSMENLIQKKVNLDKTESTYIKTYCKRCGKVI
jgi:hypothetical protein